MDKNIEYIKQSLQNCKQEHILKFYNELNDKQKENLINQIKSIDIEKVNIMFENSKKDEVLENRFSPIGYIDIKDLSEKELDLYKKIGDDAIKNNEVAMVTMAGRIRE